MDWTKAVLGAIRRYSKHHHTRIIKRQGLIKEELDNIKKDTSTYGRPPDLTLSRELQELRDEGVLHFYKRGVYILMDTPIIVEDEDLADDVLSIALKKGKLLIGNIPTSNELALVRRRKGQDIIRRY